MNATKNYFFKRSGSGILKIPYQIGAMSRHISDDCISKYHLPEKNWPIVENM
jgi:hypothetical protein